MVVSRILVLTVLFAVFLHTAWGQGSVASNSIFMYTANRQNNYFAFGQDLRGDYHFSDRWTGSASIGFYTAGKYSNRFTATAKTPGTLPASTSFEAVTRLYTKHFTMGARYYFKGSYRQEYGYSLYGYLGYGILFMKVQNDYNAVDTAAYDTGIAPSPGEGKFNRLTIDGGAGIELPIGPNVFLYGEARAIVPLTDYPSRFIVYNKGVPLPLSIGVGIRVLFDRR